MTGVTAIIPVWNGRELLAQLLGRLRVQTYSVTRIMVVDNGSTDGSAEVAEGLGACVIRMGRNAGFAPAVNRGIAECQTEFVAIVNADVEPAPDWLALLMEAAGEPGVWFATGKLLNARDRERIDGTWDALCRGGCAWRVGSGRPDGPEFSALRKIRLAPLTAAVFRAELFQRTGPLDELFESYMEDVELGIRCACLGLGGVYVPRARAWHIGSATFGKWRPEVVRLIARNQILLLARHYSRNLLWRCGWAIHVAQTLWGLLALRHGAFPAFVAGKAAGLRLFKRARLGRTLHDDDLLEILINSEREIYHMQRGAGFAPYWRMYFALTSVASN